MIILTSTFLRTTRLFQAYFRIKNIFTNIFKAPKNNFSVPYGRDKSVEYVGLIIQCKSFLNQSNASKVNANQLDISYMKTVQFHAVYNGYKW